MNKSKVILLHGLGRTIRSFYPLGRSLQKAGYTPIGLGYDGIRQSADICAEQLRNKITNLFGSPPLPLCFVTHSFGGILVRMMVKKFDLEIVRCVMIAPPNQGSELVDLGRNIPILKIMLGKSGAQLGTKPDSLPNQLGGVSYPVGIIAGTRPDHPFARFCFPGPNDGRVAVTRTKVEGMTDFLTFPYGHFYLAWMPSVQKSVVHFLRCGSFS